MPLSEGMQRLSDFLEFIEKDMRMSHIYQPLLIRMLLESGGASTLRDLALRFVTFNEAELQAMEQTLKKMPVQVLKNRGWVERDGDTVRLTVKPNDLKERSMLIGACERRLHEFIELRGEKIWDYRWLDDPVGGSFRFEILAASGQKCALCGISAEDRPLDVDHIVPRSKGGKSTADNLQVLCSKCNRSKGNRDDRDFRSLDVKRRIYALENLELPSAAEQPMESIDSTKPSIFDKLPEERVLLRTKHFFVVEDGFPIAPGHLLIISNRPCLDWFSLTPQEQGTFPEVLEAAKAWVEERHQPDGFNVGMNCGEAAGQTVMHFHCHLIPRTHGDTPHPRGGVRGVIPSKQSY
jgi:diadenosine tetraphosphate (Ap4A) HIT family hydrolase